MNSLSHSPTFTPAPKAGRQLSLSLDLPPSIPLVHVETAENILNSDNDRVCEAIELGILLAFDISGPSAKRSEVRVYRDSLRAAWLNKQRHPGSWLHPRHAFCAQTNIGRDGAPSPSASLIEDAIKRSLPPGDKPFFPLRTLSRRWSCSPTHIYNLVAAGCLATVAPAGRGPTGSAMILRTSAVTFLTANCESIPANPNGVPQHSPGLRGTSYPGNAAAPDPSTLKGLHKI